MKRSSSHAIAKFSCVPVVSHPPSPGETWHGGISVNFFEVFSQLVAKVAAADPSCEIETRSSSSSSSCEFYIHRCYKLRRAVRIKLTAGTKKHEKKFTAPTGWKTILYRPMHGP